MSRLDQHLCDYLELRRSMGYRLRRAEKLLRQFIDYCAGVDVEIVTIEVALQWATLPDRASSSWVAHRLGVVRSFSRYLAVIDPAHQVVPANAFPHRPARAVPFLYSETEVLAMMTASRSLPSPVRQATFETIIGLLWATGMRIGEAINLDQVDVDLAHGVLTVRDTKFGKTRELPAHETTTDALATYDERRARWFPHNASGPFFVSAAGTRVLYCNFHLGFKQLVERAGLQPRSRSCRPRPHDLRHAFAVRTLIGWYRDGVDVEASLPKLSTYLGHVLPAHTYWYLSAAPELLALAAGRLDTARRHQL